MEANAAHNLYEEYKLIYEEKFVGDKAFNWEKQFPSILKNGGFDVIIGNPPYVNVELMPIKDKEFYKSKYSTFLKERICSVFFLKNHQDF